MKISKQELMKYLLVASICTIPAALVIMSKMEFNLFNPSQNFWVFLILGIIPISSIIIGIINIKDNGIANIVIGGIIAFYLISFGIVGVEDNKQVKYEKVYEYNEILNIKLPEEGKAYYQHYDDDYYVDFEYDLLNVDYDKKYRKELLKNIEENDKYLYANNLNKELIQYIPTEQRLTHDYKLLATEDNFLKYESYIMIYNKTTNEYNEQITRNGKNILYIVRYIPQNGHLSICNYVYNKKI